ncbi:MAG: aminomethyl-transferring glycine dehydrogenase subunit GcvPA [Candidatus Kapabacteria bacterium]|nr:aminomethyl-transferring glycine dehydrogenase subunit GcvPA [Candidatus Kapabacteria bacterium]MDW7997599.1 aminomethyl-transferring glycine dehydrogenase subunit GcvPA [Bacteroidota bacterium]MDW8224735.1 aminomethyl-transferring glycine dehydrogenase subunit GcvPA [Bacteroidota bacterium]
MGIHPFLPLTEEERRQMLQSIGVLEEEELFRGIPEQLRLREPLPLPPQLSEWEAYEYMRRLAACNGGAHTHVCFMGAGAYDHYVPAVVDWIIKRSEFQTAYTPYQAEVSQGTLQSIYEFQSMVCQLTAMDVANASLYDGASAVAEACMVAFAATQRRRVLFAGTVHPHYRQVVRTVCSGRQLLCEEVISPDGTASPDLLAERLAEDVAAVVLQQPNFYGTVEEKVQEVGELAHRHGALFVVVADPVSLGILEPPGAYGADIVVGEGQSLGIPLNFGGPYVGFFAARKQLIRLLPGRIAAITEDVEGRRGFVLTLQTREQQIKRERATSNICTNQGLMMLAATVYMAWLGKQGIQELAQQCLQRARYLAERIAGLPGYEMAIRRPFLREFLVRTPVPAEDIVMKGLANGYLAGVPTRWLGAELEGLLIAVTEKRSRAEMDAFVEFLAQFSRSGSS